MKIVCATCKYEYDSMKSIKCPRCGAGVPKKGGCEGCKGCSLWKSCNIK